MMLEAPVNRQQLRCRGLVQGFFDLLDTERALGPALDVSGRLRASTMEGGWRGARPPW